MTAKKNAVTTDRVVEMMKERPGISAREIGRSLGASSRVVDGLIDVARASGMIPPSPLTARDCAIYEMIFDATVTSRSWAPSVRDIANALSASLSTVQKSLYALDAHGLIERGEGARMLRVADETITPQEVTG